MKIKLLLSIFLVFFVWIGLNYKVDAAPVKYAADFLNIGAGAREMSMGEAVASVSTSPSAMFWNPAGLYFMKKDQISLQHTFYGESLADYHFLGYAIPLGDRAEAGIGWLRFGVGNIPVYPDIDPDDRGARVTNPDARPDPEPEGWFSSANDAVFITIARGWSGITDLGWIYKPFYMGISGGVAVKLVRERIGDYTGSGLGMDLGLRTELDLAGFLGPAFLGKLYYGLSVTDVSATSITWDTPSKKREYVAPLMRTGAGYEQDLPFSSGSLLVTWDAEFDLQYDEKLRNMVGVEYGFRHRMFLRFGLRGDGWSGGAGFVYRKLVLDYAFISYGVAPSHRIELEFSPGLSIDKTQGPK
jgi:hypothetical protein